MTCELIHACMFYRKHIESGTGLGVLYRKSYCDKDFVQCARHRVAKIVGTTKVPPDLYPNMVDRAEEIIATSRGIAPGSGSGPIDS